LLAGYRPAGAPSNPATAGDEKKAPEPAPPGPGIATDEKKASNQWRIRAGSFGETGRPIRQPRPVYPKEAKRARIQGTVTLAIDISKTGEVISIRVISGHPALVPAAVDAVRKWRYAPSLLNSDPIEVKSQVVELHAESVGADEGN
jgi:protein TonB